MKLYAFHRQFFHIIQVMMNHGVSLYGYGENGKKFEAFFQAVSIPVCHIYDRASALQKINSGGVLSPIYIPASDDHAAVCVITPFHGVEEILPLVKPYYDVIIGVEEMRWLMHMLPKTANVEAIDYQWAYPFDFYESPFITQMEYENEQAAVHRQKTRPITEIDWNLDVQHAYCRSMLAFASDYREDLKKCCRYEESNGMYEEMDVAVYYGMLRKHRPKRIIEIGSGFSTRFAMDVSDVRFDDAIEIICIEPYPQRLLSGIKRVPYKKLVLKQQFVQSIDLSLFDTLKAGDILFIDSSHVIRAGGDVPFELFEILPHLTPGVLIHFHDVFYPFTYPREWLRHGQPYTETYALRAFLSYNDAYEILFFSNMMAQDPALDARKFCQLMGNQGGSLWLRKKK